MRIVEERWQKWNRQLRRWTVKVGPLLVEPGDFERVPGFHRRHFVRNDARIVCQNFRKSLHDFRRCGLARCLRLKARSWRVSAAARSPAFQISESCSRAGSSRAAWRSNISLYPLITVSVLLKS